MEIPPDRVRLATWNCFGAPQSLEDFLSGQPFWPERLEAPAVLATLSGYDIVCIQENLVDRVRTSLEVLRAAGGFPELWFDPMGPCGESKTFVGGGLAILSRFPVTARFVKLPRGEGPDGYARKGFSLAEVRLPSGRELYLANTHLQADDERVSLAVCRRARWSQLEALRDGLSSILRDGAPLVLCGDMNVPHGSDEYERVARLFGDELVDVVGREGFHTYDIARNDIAAKFHEGGPEKALIDYVWTSRARVEAKEVAVILEEPIAELRGCPSSYAGRAFASDHYGVGAVIAIE
jgi:endonuclease/exonuclease/phosphatase family metal-dependent hydrolase